ncbi:beta strand repeat-containing protein [Haliscomenobacter sp.]|uniref:beta strand repeat-containing protein n=1 Tax=Haliscomenobacter sp. TaxID=2717303 RepID=UPI003BAD2551
MQERVQQTLKKNAETIRFIENKGQIANNDVLYYFESKNGSVYIEHNRIRFVAIDHTLLEPLPGKTKLLPGVKGTHTFSIYLDGSNPNPHIELGQAFNTKYNYFFGEDTNKWVSSVRAAKDLTLEDVYPGIDLRLYSTKGGALEFDWIFDAGADYSQVKMQFDGQDKLVVNADGSLQVGLRFTDVKLNIPESYQVTDAGKVQVHFNFNKYSDNQIAFTTNDHLDPDFPLVIDPTLSWGTFVDGANSNFDAYLYAIQVDPDDGTVYCAGGTNRDFPTGTAPYDANGYLNSVSGLSGGTGISSLPNVAIVYRMNSNGTDLLDLTLYGPSTISGTNRVIAQALSLSSGRVFIGGATTVDIPTTGSPFDNARSGTDGFVAVFSRDLGTLHYATYLGGTGDENVGVTSIRALSDNSFVVGLTAAAALPGTYISAGVAQTTFGGGSDMYIAKFSSNNTLTWGTYVGGSGTEVFNDLEVFANGRVTFAGSTTGTITQVNSAAGNSTGSDSDGVLGVLNSTATSFNYLDKIGGTGDDRINDVEIVGEVLYWTGSATTVSGTANDFPTGVGVYDATDNGGIDVVVGKVNAGGSSGYAATFYGTSATDIGSGIRLVSQTDCEGNESVLLMVFGVVAGSGLPTQNINGESFFNSSHTSGGNFNYDMFFAGFNSSLNTLLYGTYMGGNADDYLGDTGAPRGANHLWVNNGSVFLGTTTHSSSLSPTLVSGGFDSSKSNGGNDSHIILAIQFTSLVEVDYGDAPSSYGTPSHILDCMNLHIGNLLDAETAAAPNALATGDDIAGLDDEDGVSTLPTLTAGGPQNVSVNVNNIVNNEGSAATLYGWIDLNSNGQFEANEVATVSVASGFTGTKTLTWTGVSVSGALDQHYMRIRLTTSSLTDDTGTTAVDERSTAVASTGEVEDYLLAAPASSADLSISKTDGSTTYTPGVGVTYTVVVSNAGPSNVVGATVADNAPTGTTITSWSAVFAGGATGTASGTGNISQTVSIPSGGSITYTITVSVPSSQTGNLVNTATVSVPSGTTDPTPGNNSATDTDTATPSADLVITKTDGSATYTPGVGVTYTVVASNAGPSNVVGATVADNAPTGTTITSWSAVFAGGATGTASGTGNISQTVSIPSGGSITYTINVSVPSSRTGNLVNTATVSVPSGTTDPTPGNNSATDTDTPAPSADLVITKTDGSATYTPGVAVTYTVVASNAGPSNVVGATVTDNAPTGTTITSWSAVFAGGATGTASGTGNISQTVSIPSGGSITYTITVSVPSSQTGNLVNTATVSVPSGTTDPTPGNNSATDTDTAAPSADLSITKTDGSTTYTPGVGVTYTVVASNAGPSNVVGATVTDSAPAGTTISSWSAVFAGGATGTASGTGNISQTVSIPSGGSITYTINVSVPSSQTGNLVNTATVSVPSGTTDPTPGNNSATDTDTAAPSADLSITKTDGSATYTPGVGVTYTVVASNAGPSNVVGATVTDSAPAGTSISSWSAVFAGGATGTASGTGNISQTVSIPSGGSITYTINVSVPSGQTGNLVNTATVSVPSGTTDPTPGNNTATDTDTPAPSADMVITKTDGSATYTPGVGVTYTVVASNVGPSNVVGATVVDNAPAGTTISSWSAVFAGGATGTASGTGNISQTVSIPSGGSITYTINVSVPSSQTGNLVNTATVSVPSGTTDPTPGNNSATDTDTPAASADLSITKTDGSATYTPGVAVTYTVVASNAGPSNVVGATVVDNAPAGTTIISWSAVFAGGATGTASGTGNISQTVSIPSGGSITYTITVSVPSSQTGNLVNTATVSVPSGTTDPTPGNNSATDTDTPAPSADLVITKTDGSATYTPGVGVTYTVVASNAGPSNVVGATVVDNAPAGTTIISWSAVFAGGATGTASGTGNISQTVSIPSGGSITYTITVSVPSSQTGNLVNTATVSVPSGTTDPTPGNNSATDTDTPAPSADLVITKTDGSTTYTLG